MNERIREIAVSAGMSQINRRSDGFYVVSEKTFELFATELIRECRDMFVVGGISWNLLNEKLENFGVEE
jgi:hypothetical protein